MKNSSEDKVVTERVDNVFLIGINRPHKRNCVNTETANLLLKAFKDFEKDDNSYVAILYGKGGTFCAGYDLSEVSSFSDLDSKGLDEVFSSTTRPMGPTHMMFSKPTIAAVSGYAVAGGLELALLCDLRVVEQDAVMGVFCRRFGVPLLDGGTVRLPHIVGLGRALDLTLTGRGIRAKEALEFGLANRVVNNGQALAEAITLAQTLCKFPQHCLRSDRRSTYYSMYDAASADDALRYEWEFSKDVILRESIQGASKFVSGIGRHGNFTLDHTKLSKL